MLRSKEEPLKKKKLPDEKTSEKNPDIPCECHQQPTVVVIEDSVFLLFMVIFINATPETSYSLNSFLKVISIQVVRVYMAFLFYPYLFYITNIGEHRGRKMLFTKNVGI